MGAVATVMEKQKKGLLILSRFYPRWLYINDLHNSIRFSSPLFHFADDTVLRNIQDIHAINKTFNKDLRELSFWCNGSEITLSLA